MKMEHYQTFDTPDFTLLLDTLRQTSDRTHETGTGRKTAFAEQQPGNVDRPYLAVSLYEFGGRRFHLS